MSEQKTCEFCSHIWYDRHNRPALTYCPMCGQRNELPGDYDLMICENCKHFHDALVCAGDELITVQSCLLKSVDGSVVSTGPESTCEHFEK